jgi:type I restriction enzyme, S subunit
MNNLPDGWTCAAIGDICDINPRRFDSVPTDDELISKVPMAAVEAESGKLDASELVQYGSIKGRSLTPFQENDVLFAKVTPCMENGKIALARGLQGGRAMGSTELFVLRSRGIIDPAYLMYFLLQKSIRETAERAMTGAVGLRRVPRSFLSSIQIPFPRTIGEQQRIVSALESWVSRLSGGLGGLRNVDALLNLFLSSSLSSAFHGTLVSEDLSHGTALDIPLRSLAVPIERAPWELPSGWAWRRVGELFKVSVGATPNRSNASLWQGDIPWVSSGEVAFNRIDHTRESINITALANPTSRIHPPGTVMIAMIGEGRTRGQAAILDIAAAHNQNCASIRVSETRVLPEYVYWFLRLRYNESRRDSSGGNQPALNKGKVENILIPLAPFGTQRNIVAALENVDSEIEQLRSIADSAANGAGALRRALFDSAFSGRLAIPQDGQITNRSAVL